MFTKTYRTKHEKRAQERERADQDRHGTHRKAVGQSAVEGITQNCAEALTQRAGEKLRGANVFYVFDLDQIVEKSGLKETKCKHLNGTEADHGLVGRGQPCGEALDAVEKYRHPNEKGGASARFAAETAIPTIAGISKAVVINRA